MTRLTSADFFHIPFALDEFDEGLRRRTGKGLKEIAVRAAGISEDAAGAVGPSLKVAAVGMTCGEGVLTGFAEAVAAIAGYVGANAFATRATDAAGLAEAFESGADIVLLADEERFVALNLATRRVSDNSRMTGRAFATALDLMAGGLTGRKALVLGCGPVGRAAAEALTGYGASVEVFDSMAERSRSLALELAKSSGVSVVAASNLREALSGNKFILDATPAGAFIQAESIGVETILSAPGIPCGATPEAAAILGERLLHDPLCLGVATMVMDAAKGEAGRR